MGRLQKVYDDLKEVYNEEKSKPIRKTKGASIMVVEHIPARIKHKYTGVAQIQGDTIIKVYPCLDNITEFDSKKIKVICDKNQKGELGGFQWSYVKNL